MDRKQQLFAKIRLIAYALVIAIFAIAGVSLFISAQFRRAMYTDSLERSREDWSRLFPTISAPHQAWKASSRIR